MFWAAGHYTVFDDEAFSCRRYAMPVGEMISGLWHGVEPDPPLFYVLENAWVGVFGVGPLALRSLPIIFFLIGLLVMRLAGQAWFDRRTGLVTMLLCALHPAHLFFGFAARWYSLMFLMTALLLWLTVRLATADRVDRRLVIAWSLAAAGACYTNYFGPVVVGLAWLAGLGRSLGKTHALRRWGWAAAGVVALCLPWLTPFWKQMVALPTAGGDSALSCAGLLARTLMALLAGNLASIEAWWVWAPLGVFGVAVVILAIRQWRTVQPFAPFVLACLLVGIISRTMIDKYVMTFSGAVCLLVAALLVRNVPAPLPSPARVWSRAAVICLVIGWLGCGVNLASQKHWSSLRWLDPFEQVIAELFATPDAPPRTDWVMTHPSARYYFGCLAVRTAQTGGTDQAALPVDIGKSSVQQDRQSPDRWPWKIDGSSWRRYAEPPGAALNNLHSACGTPASILERMRSAPVPSLATVETAGFRELADQWGDLLAALNQSFTVTGTREYLEDPAAAFKNWLDPTVTHPRWRIAVRLWRHLPPPADGREDDAPNPPKRVSSPRTEHPLFADSRTPPGLQSDHLIWYNGVSRPGATSLRCALHHGRA
jgi:hypothetical protein